MQDNIKEYVGGLKHICRAVCFSVKGLNAAIKNETAIRHELMFGAIHFIALALVPMSFSIIFSV